MTIAENVGSPSDATTFRWPVRRDRSRFVVASAAGLCLAALPYLWVLFVLWNGRPNLLRIPYSNGYTSNFYDLQGRALLSGHLYVPKGSLAIEAWVHNGHDYTYFGLFPSLLRLPILLVTHSLDGRLTALSLLAAWLVTGLFTSMLVWRIRIFLRGNEELRCAEAVTLGALIATVMGGSVLVFLAAEPFVYSEDKAWSVALTLGGFFALLGVLERPSWRPVLVSGLFIIAANLTRVTDGYACVVGAVLVAIWFAIGNGGPINRRWGLPMLGVAFVAVAAGSAVNWAKFGSLFGLPLHDYVAFHLLGEQKINGGQYFSLRYLPTTVWAYLEPGGLSFSTAFPFITLPAGPPHIVGNVMFDNITRTTSVTASMPLLSLFGIWGVVAVLYQRSTYAAKMLGILLLAALTGTGAVLLYGWIADRYLADFLPFLILASAVGILHLWHWLGDRPRIVRVAAAISIVALGLFGITANVALSITPTEAWTTAQASRFVHVEETVSKFTGAPLTQIMQGGHLPYWAPAGTLFIAGNCEGLYVSNGEDYAGVLNQRAQHRTWVVVEEGVDYGHTLNVQVNMPTAQTDAGLPLVTIGQSRLLFHSKKTQDGLISVWFSLQDPKFPVTSPTALVQPGSQHTLNLVTDRFANVLSVSMDNLVYLSGPMTANGPVILHKYPNKDAPITSTIFTKSAPDISLCRALLPRH